jgi:hypothetical protein
MRSAALEPPNLCWAFARAPAIIELQESVKEHSTMTAHIRLAASEGEDGPGLEGKAIGLDEATVGLPEEAGSDTSRSEQSRRNEMLGEAAPPLFAEREDRAGGRANGRERPKGALARLMALAGPRKAKAAAPVVETGSAKAQSESEPALGEPVGAEGDWIVASAAVGSAVASADERPKRGLARFIGLARSPKAKAAATVAGSAEAEPETALGKRRDEEAGAELGADPIGVEVANGAEVGVASGATTAAKARRPLFASKGTIAVVLLTGVAAAAIMMWTWPRPVHPLQVMEPGMLADQPTKLMAPSAALAKVSPREGPNVARDRPEVRETRRDEVKEVLSFKGLDPTASPPASPPPPTASSPAGESVSLAKPAVPAVAPLAPSTVADSKPKAVAQLPPPPDPDFIRPLAPEEPGLGEAAKIESRLGELEAALKDRSNMPVTRADVDKAETQTSGQIAQLAAIVTRLTGQVKDLQGQVQTMSSGSETKFADLTRRVSMSESKSAVAAAESSAAAPSAGVEGQAEGARAKAAGADQKHNYRIQAASPGLAMLSAIDGGADTRPVEIAIGTDLPGYGKVRSIEQHGQAWIVKTDRGEIE